MVSGLNDHNKYIQETCSDPIKLSTTTKEENNENICRQDMVRVMQKKVTGLNLRQWFLLLIICKGTGHAQCNLST